MVDSTIIKLVKVNNIKLSFRMRPWHSWLAQQIFNLWVEGSSPSERTNVITNIHTKLSTWVYSSKVRTDGC